MNIKERLKYCQQCKNKALDYDKNIICDLTSAPPVFERECKYFIHKDVPDDKTEKTSNNSFFGTWKSAILLVILAGYNIIRGIANENYYNVVIGIVLLVGWFFFVFSKKKKK
ncbi:LPXTG cell wall anchor domain-containing protein [Zobellia galactanivorans]|uniref:LPXTG cell wall anchor domain-containing protein n=1 Tax=Zobellia galactanivorans (strain DSM 12802 / CCUG 47099 / CIP 106680 / NCIMB 13871 / Dsij) TaxID=63186 RepID=UPI0026E114A6|nr:LPXTG cell wall anchor domain-containing protein [Zobellia galactanivorans]MDO6808358.1 LPXTG cell wall anchor domain-containing protein [Zobellia galactanivorans]